MTRLPLAALKEQLVERDYALLASVDSYRLLTTKQIQRLHFDQTHPTPLAAARACNRALVRLRDHGVLKALQRRIGGARAGSAGLAWYVGPAGERLLRDLNPQPGSRRRNYREPTRHFVDHTLAVAELAVQAIEAGRSGLVEVLTVEAEPMSWQQSMSSYGTVQWLKPDLRLVTATAAEEIHTFVEADLATEHLPVIVRQCQAYDTFRATGRYQAEHDLFPTVLWVTPTAARAAAIRTAITAAARTPHGAHQRLDTEIFQVCVTDQYAALIGGQPPPEPTTIPDGPEGGTPS